MTALGAFLVEDGHPQSADLAVALAGDEYGTRILRAGQLARDGLVPYALISYPMEFESPGCGGVVGYAVYKGFPAALFREFPNRADSTRSEAAIVDRYLRQHGLHKLLLVTSNFHTRRAASLFRHQDPSLQVVPIPAPDPYFTPSTWWKSRNGQKTFFLEWCKTFATWLGV